MFATIPFDLFAYAIISLLAESNRVPFDLAEAESELVAGFSTSYSSVYFSVLMLSEYLGLIVGSILILTILHSPNFSLIYLLLFICALRSSFLRIKFDDLLYFSWLFLLLFLFLSHYIALFLF
jgi:NADH-quinone oxidoreductase subunit H